MWKCFYIHNWFVHQDLEGVRKIMLDCKVHMLQRLFSRRSVFERTWGHDNRCDDICLANNYLQNMQLCRPVVWYYCTQKTSTDMQALTCLAQELQESDALTLNFQDTACYNQ